MPTHLFHRRFGTPFTNAPSTRKGVLKSAVKPHPPSDKKFYKLLKPTHSPTLTRNFRNLENEHKRYVRVRTSFQSSISASHGVRRRGSCACLKAGGKRLRCSASLHYCLSLPNVRQFGLNFPFPAGLFCLFNRPFWLSS